MIDEGLTPIQLSRRSAASLEELPPNVLRGGTDIYTVNADPNLIIRDNTDGESLSYMLETAKAFNTLPSHGIESLPYMVIEHNEAPIVVTTRATGIPLIDILKNDPSEEQITIVDQNWTNLVRMTTTIVDTEELMPQDISSPGQYIMGTTADDSTAKLRMIDLGEYAHPLSSTDGSLELDLINIAGQIIHIENLTGKQLINARRSLHEVLAEFQPTNHVTEKFHVVVAHILKSNEFVDPTDDDHLDDIWTDHDFKYSYQKHPL